jgi:hypothetical protein
MTDEKLTAIRKRAENSIGRGPDWDDFEALMSEVARLRAALEAVEWVADDAGFRFCPWCESSEQSGHFFDCQRQRTLAVQL